MAWAALEDAGGRPEAGFEAFAAGSVAAADDAGAAADLDRWRGAAEVCASRAAGAVRELLTTVRPPVVSL
jgi:hypothetical protein